ncbi:MAG TPA: DUF4824 family protein [Anaeromyxobacteraceae bacterium]|nr:DUF4824 family protein [Anaeromyxobacteraceae bacterium]
MKRPALLAAAALVLAASVFALCGVVWNRHGEPEATLTLTEREAPLAWSAPSRESSGVALRLSVHGTGYDYGYKTLRVARARQDGLEGARLAALGFDTALPRDLDQAYLAARRQLSRPAFAAVELGGAPWEAWKRALAAEVEKTEAEVAAGKRTAEALERERRELAETIRDGSRLFLVEVDRDPEALRSRHPDRQAVFVAPVTVDVHVDHEGDDRACDPSWCRLQGSVSLLVDEVNVPRQLQGGLREAMAAAERERGAPGEKPHYQVVLRSGRRHEPWIEAIGARAEER